MNAPFLSLIPLLLAAAACSSSSSSAGPDAGNDAGGGVTLAEAFVAATVGVGPQSPASSCPLSSPEAFLSVGTATASEPTVVPSGHTTGSSTLELVCTVAPANGGFDVALRASFAGTGAAQMVVTSPVGLGAVTTAGASGLSVAIQNAGGTTFEESACTLAYTYLGHPITGGPGVSAGKIFGHLSCPTATPGNDTNADAGSGDHCDAEIDVLFENCTGS